MDLNEYFTESQGIGVLSTADSNGAVDSALYSRPHCKEEKCLFIMADRLSHKNLQDNPHAAYLFLEQGPGYKGVRLYLTRIKESEDKDLAESLRRKKHGCGLSGKSKSSKTFVVEFKVDSIRPLVGDDLKNMANICPTCMQPAGESGHLCVPVTQKDKKCQWCGALIVDQRHLCNSKIKDLAYICSSCGRTAVKAEHLCHPVKIKK